MKTEQLVILIMGVLIILLFYTNSYKEKSNYKNEIEMRNDWIEELRADRDSSKIREQRALNEIKTRDEKFYHFADSLKQLPNSAKIEYIDNAYEWYSNIR